MKNICVVLFLITMLSTVRGDEIRYVRIRYRDDTGKTVIKNVPVMMRQSTLLPEKVIDPKTYQDVKTPIRYVNTVQLIQRGYHILRNSPSVYYDPSIHRNVYMRIPKRGNAGEALYPQRW